MKALYAEARLSKAKKERENCIYTIFHSILRGIMDTTFFVFRKNMGSTLFVFREKMGSTPHPK